jgi:hypothetical protein
VDGVRPLRILACALLIGALLAPVATAADPSALSFTNRLLSEPPAVVAGTPASPAGTRTYALQAGLPSGDTAQKAYAAFSLLRSTYTTQFSYEATEPFQLSGPLEVKTFLSCDRPSIISPGADVVPQPNAAGQTSPASYRIMLLKGSTEVSRANLYEPAPVQCSGPAFTKEIKMTLDSKDTAFDAGDVLNIQVLVWFTNPPPNQVPNGHFLVNSTAFPSAVSGLGLPMGGSAGGGVPVVHVQLNGTEVRLDQSYQTARTARHVYNWTNALADPHLALDVAPSNGSVAVKVVAGAATLFNRTLNATAAMADPLAGATAGNWSLVVDFQSFEGSLRLNITEAPSGDGGSSGSSGSGTAGSTKSSTTTKSGTTATGNGTSSQGTKGSPAPALPVLLGALAVAVAVLRRR